MKLVNVTEEEAIQLKDIIIKAFDELATAKEMDESNRIYIFWDNDKKELDCSTYGYAENDNMFCLCSFSKYQKVSAYNYDGWHWTDFMEWLKQNNNPLASMPVERIANEFNNVNSDCYCMDELREWDAEVAREDFIECVLPDLIDKCQYTIFRKNVLSEERCKRGF